VLPANNLLRRYEWDSPEATWLLQAVGAIAGIGMPIVTFAAFVALLVRWRQIPQPLRFIIVAVLAFDVWFICWWADFAHIL
jgi:hypothetical protein